MYSFTRGMTGSGQIFVYKLYTFFVEYNASVLPLQHITFVSKPNCTDYHETNA